MNNSIWKIIVKNTFTLFNFVNVVLALMVAFVGSYKNMLFILIAIANTLISIVNEIRAKKIVDKLKLLTEQRPTIKKDGKSIQVDPDEVEKGDINILSLGDQVMYDSIVQSGQIEVNEAFITGEQDNIEKHPGDKLTSGSFVVAGTAEAKVEHIGADNFVNKLQHEATSIKTADAKLFKLMNNIVKYISWTLIPIGALLLWSRFRTEPDTTTAVTSTVAGLINMIPEGLILLTSSVLALATIRLSRKKVLVQDLYSIETLARVDCIALDKTGTLTTGNMTVHDYTPLEKSFESALKAILSHQTSENATTSALKRKFLKTTKFEPTGDFAKITDVIPFSSERKYSGIKTKKAEYLMGAIEFITDNKDDIDKIKQSAGDYRIIAVVKRELAAGQPEDAISQHLRGASSHSHNGHGRESCTEIQGRVRLNRCENDDCEPSTLRNSTSGYSVTKLLGFIRLEDEIRPTAKKIINYFYDNDIAVKIISGDDLPTVKSIAETVGVRDLTGIDLSTLESKNYQKLVQDYSIFTRVTPSEKKRLIEALKKQGNTVAMTGDGVNDILAMREADVSLAIGEGSDAARRASKLVLLNSGFESVPSIIDEGRQSINNLERSTSLFLAKTVYASLLAVIFLILPFSYPYMPIEMSLLNFACIGFPGFILALEHNTARIKNRFLTNIIEYSVPIGLTVTICMLALSITAHYVGFSKPELNTASVIITFAIDIFLIYWISRPLNKLRGALFFSIIGIFAAVFLIPFARKFFEFTYLDYKGLIITITITVAGFLIFSIFRLLAQNFSRKFIKRI